MGWCIADSIQEIEDYLQEEDGLLKEKDLKNYEYPQKFRRQIKITTNIKTNTIKTTKKINTKIKLANKDYKTTRKKIKSKYFDEIRYQSNRNANAPSLLLTNLIIYLDAYLSAFSGQPVLPLIV